MKATVDNTCVQNRPKELQGSAQEKLLNLRQYTTNIQVHIPYFVYADVLNTVVCISGGEKFSADMCVMHFA